MKRLLTIAAAVLLLAGFARAASPRTAAQRLARSLDAPGGAFESSVWGVLAVNFSGDTLADLNRNRRMVPASNLKLLTTGAALLTFGGDHRFVTTFATDGAVRDSVLCGNLYIIGGGDPLIGTLFPYLPSPGETFGRWKSVLSGAGIKAIEGRIIADGSFFEGELRHPDWSTEDEMTKDGVVPSGLTWRGNMDDLLPDGPLAAAVHFRDWLDVDSTFLAVGADACEGYATDSLTVLGTVASAPLREIVSITNHRSDNFCAETMLKALGKQYNGSDDYSSATAALRSALAPLGLKARSASMRFSDGSGLSRKNYVSPDFLVSFLRAMARTGVYPDYLESLPRPGRSDGTLKPRMAKAPAAVKDRIFMKSGSLGGVRCFSGYILPSDGNKAKTIAFSVMVNNYVGNQTVLASRLDELILALAAEN